MTINRRNLLLSTLAGVGLSAVPGLTISRAADGKTGGVLVVSNSVEPVHLVGAFTTQAGPPTSKIFDGLIKVGLDGRPAPALAEAWEVSGDGKTITFHLRKGVKFHDGTPLTPDDVAFSLDVWKKYHARGRGAFANVTGTHSPDDHTIIFDLSVPSPVVLLGLVANESPVLARHTYPAEGDLAVAERNNSPIGTGPFRFVEWERGSHIALEKNQDYWDAGHPLVDQLIIRTLPDPATTSAAIEAGTVQVSSFVPLSNIVRLQKNADIQVIDDPRGSLYAVGAVVFEFNLDRERFRDRALRTAFAHSIDRDFIQKNLYYGFATPTESPIPPGLPEWHNADVPKYIFDLEKAENILEEAGYKRNSEGVRLKLFNDYAANNATHLLVAQFIRSTLAKIGVDLEIRNQDFGQFVNRAYTKRDFDTIIYHATVGPDPAIGAQRFYWSKNFKPGVAFSNAANYSNPEVDRLLEAAGAEIDPARRRQYYNEFQRIVQEDIVRIPVISPRYPLVARANLSNVIEDAAGGSGSNSQTHFN
ncbi:ABC transporter substrate-binding protein [Phyllobacterium lublinensis]|uniref:ABC transporter substrate-binding protein n=1 Tax=Phyllobacterium lublinensis TaxID=2875708 RepID=UPI001CC9EA69|nr:ABC transporter substrate-binding protein [Phyllobacterium sp. 2063]MBZ9655252.1 ABC transporter substrate-binding protein [Phyllobacterium sp. 2063]